MLRKLLSAVKSGFTTLGKEAEIELGALIDVRPPESKKDDIHFDELVASANPVTWVEKSEASWRKFPIYSQNGSGSCVAQTMAKLMGVLYYNKNKDYVHFSATHIYQRRKNKPASGMSSIDVFDVAKEGVTLEELVPSQKMTDNQMDSVKIEKYKEEVGEIFKTGDGVFVPIKNIDSVASIIETTGKAVMVWFYFAREEWTNVPAIKIEDLPIAGEKTLRHSVTAVDYTLYKGEKALIIEDSWGVDYGIGGRRIITESFFSKRNFFAGYPMNFKFDTQTDETPAPVPTPQYQFTKELEFIPWDYSTDSPADKAKNANQLQDVKAMQEIFKKEGLFPTNVASTGYYGAVTAKAVDAYQRKYAIAPLSELNSLQGRRVGKKTLEHLNSRK